MLAAAVLPTPPLLVPALTGGAAESIAPLLAVCDQVVRGLLDAADQRSSTVVCLGPGARTMGHDADAWGSFAGYGVDLDEPARPTSGRDTGSRDTRTRDLGSRDTRSRDLGSRDPGSQSELPLSLTLGRWLLHRGGWAGPLVLQEIAIDATAADCVALAGALTDGTPADTVWLVMGDGSICRGPKSPGYDDPRAEGFDQRVAAALGQADLAGLLDLDVALAAELGAAGRSAWQVLAAAAQPRPPRSASLEYDEAPFGVGYFAAGWRFAA